LLSDSNWSIPEDGYCRLTIATVENDQYSVKVAADYSHAPQTIAKARIN
jgi:hypothetical protein